MTEKRQARRGWRMLLLWGATLGFGWLWWRYYQTGAAYQGRWYRRSEEPFSYWLLMVSFAAAIGVLAVCAVHFTLNGP